MMLIEQFFLRAKFNHSYGNADHHFQKIYYMVFVRSNYCVVFVYYFLEMRPCSD